MVLSFPPNLPSDLTLSQCQNFFISFVEKAISYPWINGESLMSSPMRVPVVVLMLVALFGLALPRLQAGELSWEQIRKLRDAYPRHFDARIPVFEGLQVHVSVRDGQVVCVAQEVQVGDAQLVESRPGELKSGNVFLIPGASTYASADKSALLPAPRVEEGMVTLDYPFERIHVWPGQVGSSAAELAREETRFDGSATCLGGILRLRCSREIRRYEDVRRYDDSPSGPRPQPAFVEIEKTVLHIELLGGTPGLRSWDTEQRVSRTRTTRYWRYDKERGWYEEQTVHEDRGREHRRSLAVANVDGVVNREDATAADEQTFWYVCPYFRAGGTRDTEIEWQLERLERYFGLAEQSVERGRLELADRQLQTIVSVTKDLRKALAQGDQKGSVEILHLPTSRPLARMRRMEIAFDELQSLHLQAVENCTRIQRTLQEVRETFSGNVVRELLKSAITWTNMLPTDPVDGLAGYSLNTSLFNLPRTLVSWQETAVTDAAVLADQVQTIRRLELLETAWAKVRDNTTTECRRITEHLREHHAKEVLQLHEKYAQTLRLRY